ncbi:parallel beta-helix domain-containing protein [Terrimonas pollutisoli]|uniref:parallel beta-helix domain-containing protein n=1 Tax=Terrimonas pollutisoli TaxID=3034147 RepID=UPI0023EB4CC2|nr:parallel beta-helix domain-containing protein [Terrimonas sp. H1YJ31]
MKAACLLAVFLCLFSVLTAQDLRRQLQAQFIESPDGSVIEIPEGRFQLNMALWMDGKNNITIRGKGMDKSILSFRGQLAGAEGIKITNSSNIILENITVQDSKGDLIKAQLVDGLTLKNVKAEWTGKPSKNNGAYALYPVQCKNVLIDSCVAIGASDAGIYVGQSQQVIVRNSKAYHNVAGIEIENTLYADVYNNEATGNTGGILIFDLPNLVQKKGGHVRVFNNHVHHNNYPNFAPKGNIVGKVPLGTGMMVLATNNVEIYNNRIINNRTAGTAIVSYYISEIPIKDESYYPYPDQIFIHDNVYERKNIRTTMKGRMGLMFRLKVRFGKKVPHIIYDGIVDDKVKNPAICIRNNTNQSIGNIKAGNKFKGITREMSPYDCNGTIQEEVRLVKE